MKAQSTLKTYLQNVTCVIFLKVYPFR